MFSHPVSHYQRIDFAAGRWVFYPYRIDFIVKLIEKLQERPVF